MLCYCPLPSNNGHFILLARPSIVKDINFKEVLREIAPRSVRSSCQSQEAEDLYRDSINFKPLHAAFAMTSQRLDSEPTDL